MTDTESPAARRHRIARAVRNASTLDAAADLLQELDALVDLTSAADPLEEVDVPWELAELEALPDWTDATLLRFALDRRPAPSCVQRGQTKVMTAKDLLTSRRYELVGLLAQACEQAWCLGDGRTSEAMAKLADSHVAKLIGEASLAVAFGCDDEPGDA